MNLKIHRPTLVHYLSMCLCGIIAIMIAVARTRLAGRFFLGSWLRFDQFSPLLLIGIFFLFSLRSVFLTSYVNTFSFCLTGDGIFFFLSSCIIEFFLFLINSGMLTSCSHLFSCTTWFVANGRDFLKQESLYTILAWRFLLYCFLKCSC